MENSSHSFWSPLKSLVIVHRVPVVRLRRISWAWRWISAAWRCCSCAIHWRIDCICRDIAASCCSICAPLPCKCANTCLRALEPKQEHVTTNYRSHKLHKDSESRVHKHTRSQKTRTEETELCLSTHTYVRGTLHTISGRI